MSLTAESTQPQLPAIDSIATYGRPASEVETRSPRSFTFDWRDLELIAMITYVLRIPQRQRAASVKAVLDRSDVGANRNQL